MLLSILTHAIDQNNLLKHKTLVKIEILIYFTADYTYWVENCNINKICGKLQHK